LSGGQADTYGHDPPVNGFGEAGTSTMPADLQGNSAITGVYRRSLTPTVIHLEGSKGIVC